MRLPGTRPRRALLARRVRLLRVAFVLALVLVAARLVDVQVLHSSEYQQDASEEIAQAVTIPALRGTITDRNGVVLATSVPTDTVVADDYQVRHPRSEAGALAPLLDVPAASLVPMLTESSGYVPLVRNLSVAQAKKVSARAFPGITMVASSVTVTPNGDLASPVVGGVDATGIGSGGLEYEYNRALSGKAAHETLLESPTGVQLPGSVVDQSSAVAGEGLELTLDEPLQYTAEEDLAKEVAASHATSGIAVVMDVKTGQILAMADLVANPTSTGTGSAGTVTIGPTGPVEEAPSNLAVTQLYEPGSVFKLVTFSAALADGLISPGTTFTVPDQRVIDGDVFHDATPHPTEVMTATQILAQSSNIGTSEVAQELGETRLLAEVNQLGFGTMTALDFPGASPGLLISPTEWAPTDYVSLAIGQADAVSAMQVLGAYNAVADGGTYVEPKLVKAVVSPEGSVKPTAPSATHRVIPSATAGELTTMLEQVVSSGTGVAAAVPGYLVAGKTGTAQVPADDGQAGYITGDYDATFVGYAPANDPVLSAIVVVDHPTPIYGGAVAAPVFSQIMSYALHRYDVPTSPGLDGEPQATAPSTLSQLVQDAT